MEPRKGDGREGLAEALGDVLAGVQAFLRSAVLPRDVSPTQALVLGTLEANGPQRVTDLAQVAHIRQPSCTALVNTMEESGLVARRRDPSDGRAVMVELTRLGHRVLADILIVRTEVLARYLAGLTAAERASLAGALPALAKLRNAPGGQVSAVDARAGGAR